MCVDDRERGWEVHGKVRVEADRVYVEEGDQCSACVIGELLEKLRACRSGSNDESVWS